MVREMLSEGDEKETAGVGSACAMGEISEQVVKEISSENVD